MKLIVGLGNPGLRYEKTRHNIGFMTVDALAAKVGARWRAGKGDYELADGSYRDERLMLVKPSTYMNNSGLAVREVVHFYKIHVPDILVVCDDAALPFGSLRVRPRGSDGGQNGLKSVIYHLNTDDVARLRVGIANERMAHMELADFVLSRFESGEAGVLDRILKTTVDAVLTWSQDGTDKAMNTYNRIFIVENTDDTNNPKKESPDA